MINNMLPVLKRHARMLAAEESDEIINWEDRDKEPTPEMLDRASTIMIAELEAFWSVLRGTNRGLTSATEKTFATVRSVCAPVPGNDAPIRVDLAALGEKCSWGHFQEFVGLGGDMGSAGSINRELSVLAHEARRVGLRSAAELLGMLSCQVQALKEEYPAHERAKQDAEQENLKELVDREGALEASSA